MVSGLPKGMPIIVCYGYGFLRVKRDQKFQVHDKIYPYRVEAGFPRSPRADLVQPQAQACMANRISMSGSPCRLAILVKILFFVYSPGLYGRQPKSDACLVVVVVVVVVVFISISRYLEAFLRLSRSTESGSTRSQPKVTQFIR